jgi:hypothetical protein
MPHEKVQGTVSAARTALPDPGRQLLIEAEELDDQYLVSQLELVASFYGQATTDEDWEIAHRGARRAGEMLTLAEQRLSQKVLPEERQERLTNHCHALRADIARASTLLKLRVASDR